MTPAVALLLAVSPTPTPISTSVTPGFGPSPTDPGASTASAGLYAFLIVVGLIAVSVVIFIAMNRSLKTARTNLGGSVLPRREADRLPVAARPPTVPEGPGGTQEPPVESPAAD